MKETFTMKDKVVLAYSGGLDTSVIAKWLSEEYNYEVITYTANIGQNEDLAGIEQKAKNMGIKNVIVEDISAEFAKNYVFPMFRANTIYEGEYLLGTSIARPLIAKRLVEVAKEYGAKYIAHGATGKGNDQIRFELNAYALNPQIQIIAPWRSWQLNSRTSLMDYAKKHNIPITEKSNDSGSPYSMDANLLHISYEGGPLEAPNYRPKDDMWLWTKPISNCPNKPCEIELEYKSGDIIGINGHLKTPLETMNELNKLAADNGIGRVDMVENRFIGMKSRGCYETPAGTVMLKAHRAIESITLDRELMHLKDELMPKYAKLIYNGLWFAPERKMLQTAIDFSQKNVTGKVKLALQKGNVTILGRSSKTSLFDSTIASFDSNEDYNQQDAEGFIKLNALRLKNLSKII